MSNYTTIAEEEFVSFANKLFPSKVKKMLPLNGRELVLAISNFSCGYELHIYTTIEHGVSRGKGRDAIRVLLFDPHSLLTLGSSKKILRTEGATTILERVASRIKELEGLAVEQVRCRKCGAHCVQRENRTTGSKFWGCSAFPKCGKGEPLRRSHPLRDPARQEKTTKEKIKNNPSYRFQTPDSHKAEAGEWGKLVEEDQLTPTSSFQCVQYPFEYFNRVQSTIFQNGYHLADANLVLGTTTSSGKTIAAELFMGPVLYESDKTVLYVSPMKSLTNEKYREWQKTFPDKKICILTGDYTLTDKRAEELAEADIICLTSEMVDSRSRKHKAERSEWIFDVGLIILDELHIISTQRGHAVEAGVMRFSSLVPDARILGLSATVPNVADFKTWFTNLNKKHTNVINSSWRPTVLEWHFLQHYTGRYQETQESKIGVALKILKEKPTEKFLIFAHDKAMGAKATAAIVASGTECHFHSADLSMEDRLDLETRFSDRTGGLRVLVATSTLAWGCSFPARNVIILGVHRGLSEVDELDIIQEAGRAGRFGIDPKGDCYLICDNPQGWKFRTQNPRKVESTLLDPGTLGFHLLAETQNGVIWNRETCLKWFDRSLAKLQAEVKEDFIDSIISNLWKMQMLKISDRQVFSITPLGRVSANLYYLPQDIYHWYRALGEINKQKRWDSDLFLSWAIGSAPSYQLPYVPKAAENQVDTYLSALKRSALSAGIHFACFPSVKASDLYDLITENGATFRIRDMQLDAPRIVQALKAIDSVAGWHAQTIWESLDARMTYGIGRDLVQLVSLRGIGAARARKLKKCGLGSIQKLLDPKNRKKLIQTIGRPLAKSVTEQLNQ